MRKTLRTDKTFKTQKMRSKQLQLEVEKVVYRNYHLYDTVRFPFLSKPESLSEGGRKGTKVKCVYYEQFKAIFLILRLFGRYSLQVSNKGEFSSKWMSWMTGYCLINYSLQTYIAMLVCFKRIQALVDSQRNYDELIFSIHVLMYLNIHFHVPFTYWVESGNLASYLNRWTLFQTEWDELFHEDLHLSHRRSVLAYVGAIIPAVVLFLVFEKYSTLHDPWLYFLPYLFTLTATFMILGLCYFTCLELGRLSRVMSAQLIKKVEMERRNRAGFLRGWRHLWLSLCSLTEQLGTHFQAVLLSIIVTFAATFLLGLYNGFSKMLQSEFSWKTTGYLIGAIGSLCIIFSLCDAGHRASCNIACQALKSLLQSKMDISYREERNEIYLILEAIKADPPQLQPGSFFTLNRRLLVSFISNAVTYVIVLLQFKVSDEDLGFASE